MVWNSEFRKLYIDSSLQLLGIQVDLKNEQGEAIRAFVSGKDVFVALPTGFGKSFCYTLLPLVFDELHGRERSIVIAISH